MSVRVLPISFDTAQALTDFVDTQLLQGRALVPCNGAVDLLEQVTLRVDFAGKAHEIDAVVGLPEIPQPNGRSAVGLQITVDARLRDRLLALRFETPPKAPAAVTKRIPPVDESVRPTFRQEPTRSADAPMAALRKDFGRRSDTPRGIPAVIDETSVDSALISGTTRSSAAENDVIESTWTGKSMVDDDEGGRPLVASRVVPVVANGTRDFSRRTGEAGMSGKHFLSDVAAEEFDDNEPTERQVTYSASGPAIRFPDSERLDVSNGARARETPWSVERLRKIVKQHRDEAAEVPSSPAATPERALRANDYFEAAKADLSANRIDMARTNLNLAIAYNAGEPAYRALLLTLERQLAASR